MACVFLAYGTITKDRETIAIPPEFTEEIRIANNQANEHYKEKNAAGAWVKAVPPAGGPVEWIKVSRGPGFRGGCKLVKAPASA